ncbi:MAG: heterodisulfide reductase-related iron-sulfur binding cluster [Rhodospirillales bacterium]|nr:heterodisulfide reductase-related iron-sulfur binding cluster [Rhodospirillales bacterium]
METRELFWEITSLGHTLFFVVAGAAMAVAAAGVAWHVWRYARARRSPVPVHPWRGFWRMVFDVFSQRTVHRRDRAAGHAHTPIMYGFLLLLAATSIITVEYDISEPFFGFTFWHGTFYLVFSLIADLAGLGLIAGVIYMMWRRWKARPVKLTYKREYRGETEERPRARAWLRDDALFLWALLLISVTGFLQEGVRLAMDQPAWGAWSPVGWVLAEIFLGLGMDEAGAAAVRRANWWIHGIAALAFIAAIPWTKAKHIIAVLGSLSTRDALALRRLPRPALAGDADDAEPDVGFGTIAEFSWKDLLNLDACTKCGRCHEACPATASGAPLSPRDLILDLRSHAARSAFRPGANGASLIGDVIEAETLWSCRSCGACMEICPVGIEHPPMIVQMRRQLVEEGDMEQQLRDTLDMIANRGNSFGESARSRGGWTAALEFPVKDVRAEPAEHLWFVGDYASYDPRNQDVSRTVARLFRAAGLDFGLLYDSERTAGNDVRRVGEEGLFESLAEHNLAEMGEAKQFDAIVTTDPHTYNTIRNEYPDFGEVAPIRHYTSVLAELLEGGRLTVVKPLGKRVTLHDPCHLGRLNGHYDEPRRVLELIGCELIDMPRCRDNSFCCGAGGGRIWMPDPVGKERPAENRMHEAASLGSLDAFVVCCPKDLTMFEDARKTSGHEGDFVVQDLAELVAEAIDLKSIDLKEVPALVDRITEAASVRIADAVADRLADRLADAVTERVLSELADRATTTAAAAPAQPAPAPEPSETAVETAETAPAAGPWRPAPVSAAALPPYEVPEKDGPRVLVAVKRVGELNPEFAIDGSANTIADEHFEHELNEWDEAALEEALLLTERLGAGEVVAVTIGPEDAEDTLRRALAKGAHRGVRVWDESLRDADPVTIARVLAGIAAQESPDIVLTGAQSADLGHGATGSALARILGLPHAAVVLGIEWDGADAMTVTRELEGGMRQQLSLPTPALLTVQTGGSTPRYATMRMIKQARKKPIAVVDGAGVGLDQAGAVVRRLYEPPRSGRAAMIEGDAAAVAKAIADIIRDKRGEG